MMISMGRRVVHAALAWDLGMHLNQPRSAEAEASVAGQQLGLEVPGNEGRRRGGGKGRREGAIWR